MQEHITERRLTIHRRAPLRVSSPLQLSFSSSCALLIRPIHIPHVPQAIQCRRGVAEDVAGGGEAFGLGGVDDGEVVGGDGLGLVVEGDAGGAVEFVARAFT